MSKVNVLASASLEYVGEVQGLFFPGADEQGNALPPIPAVLFPALNTLGAAQAGAILGGTHDTETVKGLFKTVTSEGKDFVIWSIYTDSVFLPDLDTFSALYPTDFQIMGAWDYSTGDQVDGYAVSPALIDFMPDVWDNEEEVLLPATELTNVNLLAGQAPRDFTQD